CRRPLSNIVPREFRTRVIHSVTVVVISASSKYVKDKPIATSRIGSALTRASPCRTWTSPPAAKSSFALKLARFNRTTHEVGSVRRGSAADDRWRAILLSIALKHSRYEFAVPNASGEERRESRTNWL